MSVPSPQFRLKERASFLLATLSALLKQRRLDELIKKAFRLWLRSGGAGIRHRLWWIGHATLSYARWVKQFDTLHNTDLLAIEEHISRLQFRPRISIVMPTYNSPERWLHRSIESVRSQLYPDWELCIADDASTLPHVRAILEEYQNKDSRIKVVLRNTNGHISAASNSALELATGEFIALLDHDDELPAHALYMVAVALNETPGLNLIYSDEDLISEQGQRFSPYFKPDWNPDLLTAQNVISHLGIYRTEIVRSVGGFRQGVEGSQDWDLALRVTAIIPPSTIHHLPHILYHWRAISGSTALGPTEKHYVSHAALIAIQEHLNRQGQFASAEPAFGSFIRVRYTLPAPAPLVSILIAGEPIALEELVHNTRYPALEILSTCTKARCNSIPIRSVPIEKTRAEWINAAAQTASGDILCILEADCLPKNADWLEELVSQALRGEIGAVGLLIQNSDGNILCAQTVLCNAPSARTVSWGYYGDFPIDEKGQSGRAALQQNLTVLPPACLAIRTETFKKMGGMNALTFPNTLYGFDLCLRLIEAGYRNLWTPYARMTKLSNSLDTDSDEEVLQFQHRWKTYLEHDPAHNPNLACGIKWPFPAFPPRVNKPWRQS